MRNRAAAVEVRLFGPCAVLANGEPLPLSGPHQLGVVAQLALSAGRVVGIDALTAGLWGDDPPQTATNAVQGYVSKLRTAIKVAGGGCDVVSRRPGYLLALAPDDVDALRIERLAAEGRAALRAGATGRADRLLRQALDTIVGDPLAGLEDLPFAASARARLNEVYCGAVEDLLDARLAAGEHDGLTVDLERSVAAAPYRERRWAQLMVALYRAGRQADALQAFRRASTILRDDLGVSPGSELVALERAVLLQDPRLDAPAPAAEPSDARFITLPVLAHALIGREGLVAEIVGLLDSHTSPLLSLVGPGGVGKTSLAIAVAHEVVRRGDGVAAFVDLSDVVDEDDILPKVASALGLMIGVSPLDDIADAVRDQRTLVVADNLEQISGAGAALVRLADVIGDGMVLATSRGPLRVRRERTVQIPPISLVRHGDRPSDAMQLFSAFAAASRRGFELDSATAPIVDSICRRLDGLPLALELAAGRLRTIALGSLSARLDDQLDLLSDGAADRPARQRSLRAVLETTWSLLPPATAWLAARLSVLDAPWMLELAELLGEGVPGPIDGAPVDSVLAVTQLVDLGLLPPPDEADAYRFLGPVRAFAAEHLSDLERSTVWNALADRLMSQVDCAGAESSEPEPALLAHVDGILRWCRLSSRTDIASAIIVALERPWKVAGALRSGFEWARQFAEIGDGPRSAELHIVAGSFATNLQLDVATELLHAGLRGALTDTRRHQANVHLAQWAAWSADSATAARHADEALAAARRARQPTLVAKALDLYSWLASVDGDAERALALNREAIAAAGEDASPFDGIGRLQDMVDALLCLGRHEAALEAAQRTYESTAQLGIAGHSVLPDALTYLGGALVGVGRPAEALGPLRESIRQALVMERSLNVVETLVVLAAALAEVGAIADAAEIWGATTAFHTRNGTLGMGYANWPLVQAAHERMVAAGLSGMGSRGDVGAALGWRRVAERLTAEDPAENVTQTPQQ